MSIITFTGLGKAYGHRDIFQNLSGAIEHGARIALVGPNGSGKSTLVTILAGAQPQSEGQIFRNRGLRIGYLPQGGLTDETLDNADTLWQVMIAQFNNLMALEAELRELEAAMAVPATADSALEKYGPLQERFEQLGGYDYESQIKQTLRGLGFTENHYALTIGQLSGGQRTRAILARLLLAGPDLLLLDEPTNHLDIAAIEWLENRLNSWNGGALIVSHDRYFLDRVCNRVWEMGPAVIETYRGNYSHYLKQRGERWEQRQILYETEKARLLKEYEFVKKHMASQLTAQAKGRQRRISREVEVIEAAGFEALQGKKWSRVMQDVEITGRPIGVEELGNRIKALRDPLSHRKTLKFSLNARLRSGDQVLKTQELVIGYSDPLFTVPDLLLLRGEIAALIGPNGTGKTTFVKTLLGKMEPLAGEFSFGANLEVDYFAQAHEGLDPEKTLFQEIQDVTGLLDGKVRDYLARFLFTGDDVYKKVGMLSGGERGRLALAKLAHSDANLLFLDEPTNHLDIPAQEVLETVLDVYKGTLIIVSHDRYLVDKLATQIWSVENNKLNIFDGSYKSYLERHSATATTAAKKKESVESTYNVNRKQQRKQQSDTRKRAKQIAKIEAAIETLETKIKLLTTQIEQAGIAQDVEKMRTLGDEFTQAQADLNAKFEEWEALEES